MLKSSYNTRPDAELTGKYVVTFRKGETDEGLSLLRDSAGLKPTNGDEEEINP